MIVAPEPPSRAVAEAWFRGGTGLDPSQQIGVYREQYELRLGSAIRSAYPALEHLVGDYIEPLIAAYLAENASHSWTLDRVGGALPDWLAQTDAHLHRVDAARMDLAVHQAFTAGDGVAPDPTRLGPDTPLGHAPSLTVLRLGGAWHRYRSAVKAGESPEVPAATPTALAVYRVGHEVRHRQLHPLEATVLDAFGGGCTLIQAVETVIAGGGDVEVLQANLQTWFRHFAERQLLVVSPG